MTARGFYIALGREHAKRVFGQKDDAGMQQLVQELQSLPEMKKSGRLLEMGQTWDPIHRCLTDGELDADGGEPPLSYVVLGGKQLHKGDDYIAVLLRPDMTPIVSEALDEVHEVEFRAKFLALPASYTRPKGEKDFQEVWLAVQRLKVFFQAAAENLEAVLFTVKFT